MFATATHRFLKAYAISRIEAATVCDCSLQTITNWRAAGTIPAAQLLKLCNFAGITLARFEREFLEPQK